MKSLNLFYVTLLVYPGKDLSLLIRIQYVELNDKIYLNVGGRASVPPIKGINDVPFLMNSSMMDVDFLPAHLVIVGGSHVGLEFAQMYRRFGSEVTIIEWGRA